MKSDPVANLKINTKTHLIKGDSSGSGGTSSLLKKADKMISQGADSSQLSELIKSVQSQQVGSSEQQSSQKSFEIINKSSGPSEDQEDLARQEELKKFNI